MCVDDDRESTFFPPDDFARLVSTLTPEPPTEALVDTHFGDATPTSGALGCAVCSYRMVNYPPFTVGAMGACDTSGWQYSGDDWSLTGGIDIGER